MTYTTHSGHASIWQRLSELNATWAERRAQSQVYRTTLAELSALSSRDLTDIGIDPGDIDSIAREAAYSA